MSCATAALASGLGRFALCDRADVLVHAVLLGLGLGHCVHLHLVAAGDHGDEDTEAKFVDPMVPAFT
jgi:hypothetical protein